MNTITLSVTGLTCGHCVASVTEELQEIASVTDVSVELVKGGTSTVTVSAASPVTDASLQDAVAEAGYTLVDITRVS